MIIENNTQQEECNCCKENCISISTDKDCNIVIYDSFDCNYVSVYSLINPKNQQQSITRDKKTTALSFPSSGDGLYLLKKMTIPTSEESLYFYKNGSFWKNTYSGDSLIHHTSSVSLQEIAGVNPKVSGIKTEYFKYFSTCYLRRCFIKICQEILKQKQSICNPVQDASLTYKRDLLWAALNVIDYLVELEQYDEAKRLLESITECNGLCSNTEPCNCGCGR